jgi:hypothetical protein
METLQKDTVGCASFIHDLTGWAEDIHSERHYEGGDPWLAYRVAVAYLLTVPLVKKGDHNCRGCLSTFPDHYGDHTLTCNKGKGAMGSYRIIRHDKTCNLLAKLARLAGFPTVMREKPWTDCGTNLRPSDIFVTKEAKPADAADISIEGEVCGIDEEQVRQHGRDKNFEDTHYDVTITATHTENRSDSGQPPAAGDMADRASDDKKAKYQRLFQEARPVTNRRAFFQPLAIETIGLVHPRFISVINKWEALARKRLGPERLEKTSSGHSTRRRLSTIVHYWNSVSMIRRCGESLSLIQSTK